MLKLLFNYLRFACFIYIFRCSQEGGELGFPATAFPSTATPGSMGPYHLKTPYAVNSIGLAMDSLQTSMGCYPAGQNYHHSTTLSLFNHRKPSVFLNIFKINFS